MTDKKDELRGLYDDAYSSLIKEFATNFLKVKGNYEPRQVSNAMLLALISYSAAVAVDVQMDEEKFVKICQELFREHLASAPKWAP